ncbi:YhcN/YlaJ family sporulation lipoprotein [Bacillaceae bacterium S4-13-56]
MKKGIILFILTFFLGISDTVLSQELDHFDQHVSEESKKILTKYEEVTNVHAINDDKSLIVAIEIHHHDRLRLNSLEKKFKKEIEDKFLGYEVTVSLDKKIVMETHEMEKKIKNNTINNKDLSKKMKKIIDLSNDKA